MPHCSASANCALGRFAQVSGSFYWLLYVRGPCIAIFRSASTPTPWRAFMSSSRVSTGVPVISQSGKQDANSRKAFLAGFLGWTFDAFDFFILTFVLSQLAKD